MSRRNKSGLAPQTPKEPETGPGSAACFCRRMERRMKAEDARQRLRAEACGQITPSDSPKFADFQIGSIEALDEFYEAVREKVGPGHATGYGWRCHEDANRARLARPTHHFAEAPPDTQGRDLAGRKNSGAEVPEMSCLWEVYQADQSYENCCRWLKHRAYGKLCIDSLTFCCRTLEVRT